MCAVTPVSVMPPVSTWGFDIHFMLHRMSSELSSINLKSKMATSLGSPIPAVVVEVPPPAPLRMGMAVRKRYTMTCLLASNQHN